MAVVAVTVAVQLAVMAAEVALSSSEYLNAYIRPTSFLNQRIQLFHFSIA